MGKKRKRIATAIYLYDYVTDFATLPTYYADENQTPFYVSSLFLIISSAVVALTFGVHWFKNYHKYPLWRKVLAIVVTVVLNIPFRLNAVLMRLGCGFVRDDNDKTLRTRVKISEAMIDSGPQLIINLVSILTCQTASTIQILSAIGSVLSLIRPVVMTEYNNKRQGGNALGGCQGFSVLVYRACLLYGRIFAIAHFSARFGWIIFAILGPHVLAYLIWIILVEGKGYKTQRRRQMATKWPDETNAGRHEKNWNRFSYLCAYLLDITRDVVMITFIHVRPFHGGDRETWKRNQERYKASLILHVVFFAEDLIMILTAGLISNPNSSMSCLNSPGIMVLQLFVIAIGFCFLTMYYGCCHWSEETKRRTMCFFCECGQSCNNGKGPTELDNQDGVLSEISTISGSCLDLFEEPERPFGQENNILDNRDYLY